MDTSMSAPSADQLHASAIHFLRQRGPKLAVKVLLSCESSFAYTQGSTGLHAEITLRAPDLFYRFLYVGVLERERIALGAREEDIDDNSSPAAVLSSIEGAFKALLPGEISTVSIHPRAALIAINPQWRQEFRDSFYGKDINNQGLPFDEKQPLHIWHNLRFRSQAEIRIAEAFERVEKPPVLFLPNCLARLGFSHRENREADFLVCYKGNWGILEVDHPFSHPPSRKVHDDKRARLFKAHGIRVVEHFDAGDCWEDADGVVKKFLYLLGQ
jgi:hypothetical protein